MKKTFFFVLISFSVILNFYLYTRPEIECSINKDELFSKVNSLNEDQLGDRYAGQLLLLLLAELGLNNKISLNKLSLAPTQCPDNIVEKIVTKEVPKEVIKTIIQKEKSPFSFMKRNTKLFPQMNFNSLNMEEVYQESYLAIFKEDRLSMIQEGVYVIQHFKDGIPFETLEIKHSFKYQDKTWNGSFSSIIKRNNEKILSELSMTETNSKIFNVTSILNTLLWKQKEYKILMWVSQKEHGRHNGIIFKKDKDNSYKKYGELVLKNY